MALIRNTQTLTLDITWWRPDTGETRTASIKVHSMRQLNREFKLKLFANRAPVTFILRQIDPTQGKFEKIEEVRHFPPIHQPRLRVLQYWRIARLTVIMLDNETVVACHALPVEKELLLKEYRKNFWNCRHALYMPFALPEKKKHIPDPVPEIPD